MTYRTLEQSQSISARGSTGANESAAAPCGRTLHLGFFFDGLTRELQRDREENRISNIGRLYMAYADTQHDDQFSIFRAFYLSGLGADYKAEPDIAAKGAARTAFTALRELPQDQVTDQLTEAGKDSLSGRRTWERLSRDLDTLVAKPWKSLAVLKGMAIDAMVEISPPLRDNPISATLLKTGADTRLEGALGHFRREYQDVKSSSDIPLRWIKVSVFGFDFGATLARAFLHELAKEATPGAELQLVFAGLFDCVDRTAASNPILEHFMPFRNDLDDGGFLPGQVKGALHLVAAHERHRRVRLLGKAQRGWREELTPGMSEDVGGGLATSETKNTDLALVSLHRMYRAAFQAGVPFPPLEQLPALAAKTAELFIFEHHRNGRSALALSRHYGRFCADKHPHPTAFVAHARLYIRWLASHWRIYREGLRQLDEQQQALNNQIYTGGNLRGLLGLPAANIAQSQRFTQIEYERKTLHTCYGWLNDVDDEARRLRNRLKLDGLRATGGSQQLYEWKCVLLGEWFDPTPAVDPTVNDLFAHFIHDKIAHDPAQHGARWMDNEAYFVIRGIETPEDSWLDKSVNAFKKALS